MSYILATNGYVEKGIFSENPIPVPVANKRNLFLWAEQYVNKTRAMYSQVEIRFVRDDDIVLLNATPSLTEFVSLDRHMITLRKQSRDYLITVDELLINTVKVKPKEGDQIWEDTGGTRYKYELGSYNGEPLWRYSGAYRQVFRMHTKFLGEEVV